MKQSECLPYRFSFLFWLSAMARWRASPPEPTNFPIYSNAWQADALPMFLPASGSEHHGSSNSLGSWNCRGRRGRSKVSVDSMLFSIPLSLAYI
ncbi:hypothetical protein GE21DRAFT_1052720 [Neurospora crassa]|nr:hypothetical protein GE21DRAFT_1052720 [Neurospora crassa]